MKFSKLKVNIFLRISFRYINTLIKRYKRTLGNAFILKNLAQRLLVKILQEIKFYGCKRDN